jgi:hypothetical protein
MGCSFYLTQELRRRCKLLGLATAFMQDKGTNEYIKLFMPLTFVLDNKIRKQFNHRAKRATTKPLKIVEYVRSQWLDSTVMPLANWSVFGQSVRTNKDVEGWHRRLNCKDNGQLSFYLLLERLEEESRFVTILVRLVSEKKLKQHQTYLNKQTRVFAAWDSYNDGDMTSRELLETCSHLNGPVV